MPPKKIGEGSKSFGAMVSPEPSNQDKLIEELQEQLEHERDGRKEDRFMGIVCLVLLLDVVFFTVMPTFGGPLALLVLELLILIPLARRMGMEEVAQISSRVLDRLSGKAGDSG
ncbi:hypothetical protein [uncultured Hoeflea sp.]|jgi:cobalamin biosynthesis protein CobD/CbiB|uniref:hypothetical protein n=1 Tax=uncultured Hoeflea sp. TaxID=538666 RepID=UPI0030DAF9A5|tara:strand:- start:148 stop:489 length:342 start_codon:yes stop_codon:yes gene_type:complete